MEEFQSGQMGQTVNLLSLTSVVRIHLPPPNNESTRCVGSLFFCLYRWIRRGAGVNDAPVARQSRGTARPQAGESTLRFERRVLGERTLPPSHRQVWRFFFLYGWTRRGAGVNDAPVTRRSRGTARPQTGESTALHQKNPTAKGYFL